MKYYFSSAGYIINPSFKRIARIKEFIGWALIAADICDLLNDGVEEKEVLFQYETQLENKTWDSLN